MRETRKEQIGSVGEGGTGLRVWGLKTGQRVALGVFDGYHRGHQALGDRADCIMTMYPHPETVIRGACVPHLTSIRELCGMGISVMVLRFSRWVAALEPEVFLSVWGQRCHPTGVVVGEDFRFGRSQRGSLAVLSRWCQREGVSLEVVPLVTAGDEAIKSSRIRQLIQAGEWDKARSWMGRPYRVMGRVVKGDGRGRTLGFPTANVWVSRHKVLPVNGVYRCRVTVPGMGDMPAIVNCGVRPTFGGGRVQLEVHIPDRRLSLYGQMVTVEIGSMIRPERSFETVTALMAQIKEDIRQL